MSVAQPLKQVTQEDKDVSGLRADAMSVAQSLQQVTQEDKDISAEANPRNSPTAQGIAEARERDPDASDG